VIVAWKVVLQGLAVTGAVGVTAVSMFGADSATKARPVHVAAPKPAASTTTTIALAPVAVDGATLGPSGTSGGSSGGSSGGDFTGTGETGTGATTGAAPADTTVTTAAGVPPPTVDESGLPIALPVSAAVVIGATAGGIAVSRRRARARSLDR
jgi:hypothetical protein